MFGDGPSKKDSSSTSNSQISTKSTTQQWEVSIELTKISARTGFQRERRNGGGLSFHTPLICASECMSLVLKNRSHDGSADFQAAGGSNLSHASWCSGDSTESWSSPDLHTQSPGGCQERQNRSLFLRLHTEEMRKMSQNTRKMCTKCHVGLHLHCYEFHGVP